MNTTNNFLNQKMVNLFQGKTNLIIFEMNSSEIAKALNSYLQGDSNFKISSSEVFGQFNLNQNITFDLTNEVPESRV